MATDPLDNVSEHCHFGSLYQEIKKATKKHGKPDSKMLQWKNVPHMALTPNIAVNWADENKFTANDLSENDESIFEYFSLPFDTFTVSVTNEKVRQKVIYLVHTDSENNYCVQSMVHLPKSDQWLKFPLDLVYAADPNKEHVTNISLDEHEELGIELSKYTDDQREVLMQQFVTLTIVFVAAMYLIDAPAEYEIVTAKKYDPSNKPKGLKAKRRQQEERSLDRRLIKLRKPEVHKRYEPNPDTVGTGKKQKPHTRRAHIRRYKSGKVVHVASYKTGKQSKKKSEQPVAHNYEITT